MPYVLIAPAIIFVLLFRALPLTMTAGFSMFTSNFLEITWAGFANYAHIFTDADLLLPIGNTWLYVLGIVPATLFLAISIAVLAVRAKPKTQTWVRFVFYVPSLVSGVVIATVWRWIFHYDGIVNWIFGKEVMWFSTRLLSVAPISFIQTVTSCGLYVIILIAAFKAIPAEHYEAATIEGASRGQVRRIVMVPQVAPTIALVAVISSAASLQMFGWVWMLAPYPYAATMMFTVYREGFLYGRFGVAAAYSMILMALTVGLVLAQRRLRWSGR